MSFRNFNSGLQQDFSTNELKYTSYLSSSEFRSQTPSSVYSTPSEVSAIPCVLFGNTLRALLLKNLDFFRYGEIILSIRGDLQDASSSFGRLGQNPTGATIQLSKVTRGLFGPARIEATKSSVCSSKDAIQFDYSQRASRMNAQLQTSKKYFIHRFHVSIMK